MVLRLRTRLINRQIAPVYQLASQRIDSCLAFVTISHADKCESTGLTAHAIGYQVHVSDSTVWREELA